MKGEQNDERSGLLLSVAFIPQELLRPHSSQADLVVYKGDDGGGEGSDGSEGTGDY